MIDALTAGLLAIVAWLAWHLLGEFIGEVVGYALSPVRRRLWRTFVRARWPWPLLILVGLGLGVTLAGLELMRFADWRAGAGILLFLGGAGLALLAPFLWRDAKRDYARMLTSRSRPVV